MDNFVSDAIGAHNQCRRLHGEVGDLILNPELSRKAQLWANHLASIKKLAYSWHTHNGELLGENLATRYSQLGADYTGQQVVNQWYVEVVKYDFEKIQAKQPGQQAADKRDGDVAKYDSEKSQVKQQGTGHFTQVVWKSSQEIGIGKAFSDDGHVFVVANYYPAGNAINQQAANVFPAKKNNSFLENDLPNINNGHVYV